MAPSEKTDLLQGTLDLLILKVVALGPVHGYGIAQRIRQISNDVLQVQQGSLYPALHRLEKRGWLAADWGESEKGRLACFYKLSAKGRRKFAQEEETWNRLCQAVQLILNTAQ
ncbi:MAG TPA: PadR family transcriptional regulator [Terracidiphilus sp.]|jgi:transcriptional regulator|nr:PadR family transcriptional regulator [Terracidiphilus sp.]